MKAKAAMKAIVVEHPGGPETLRPLEVATPSPGPGEVTIDVTFAGVGLVDTLLRRGHLKVLPFPFTPGLEAAGVIREVGEGVRGLRPGQPVAAWLSQLGGYAEVALARADLTIALPSSDDAARAATVFVNGATAWLAIHDVARVSPMDTVVVLGATGGVGAFLGQLALHAGAKRVIGTVGSEAKRDAARNLGYHDVLLTDELADWISKEGNDGLNVVFDIVGGEARKTVFTHLPPFGRQVILGDASHSDTSFSGDEFWIGTKSVLGLNVGGIASRMPDLVTTAASRVLDLASKGEITGDPDLILPLDDAAEAHRLLENRTVAGKIVLRA